MNHEIIDEVVYIKVKRAKMSSIKMALIERLSDEYVSYVKKHDNTIRVKIDNKTVSILSKLIDIDLTIKISHLVIEDVESIVIEPKSIETLLDELYYVAIENTKNGIDCLPKDTIEWQAIYKVIKGN